MCGVILWLSMYNTVIFPRPVTLPRISSDCLVKFLSSRANYRSFTQYTICGCASTSLECSSASAHIKKYSVCTLFYTFKSKKSRKTIKFTHTGNSANNANSVTAGGKHLKSNPKPASESLETGTMGLTIGSIGTLLHRKKRSRRV